MIASPIPCYIGWDPREEDAFAVAVSSLQRRASVPVSVTPLKLRQLGGLLTRPVERRDDGKLWCPISEAPMSTEFAISRFVVPFLQRDGWALFCDCDMLFVADIAELWALRDPKYAVMVVKHHHLPDHTLKMDGQLQTIYARKNWSSFCLWNLDHPANQRLTLDDVNQWPGRDLHAFKWLKDDEIGTLPAEWNHLVDVNDSPEDPAILRCLHFTNGIPTTIKYANCGYSVRWWAEYLRLKSS